MKHIRKPLALFLAIIIFMSEFEIMVKADTTADLFLDFDDSGCVDTMDCIYLLKNLANDTTYPITKNKDLDGDSIFSTDDVSLFLKHLSNPVIYPISEPVSYKTVSGKYFYGEYNENEGSPELVQMYNDLFSKYSGVEGTEPLVFQFGSEACYFKWMAEKIKWYNDEAYKDELKSKITEYPQTDNGYIWSWATTTYWPTGNGTMHYDGLFNYITAVAKITEFENNTSLLNTLDTNQCGTDSSMDASKNKTVYQKCALAMDYALNSLYGRNGVIQITEDSVYLSDGITRFDKNANGDYVWNNTGCFGSASSNYWDNLAFGNYDAYETILFYEALSAMAKIEDYMGNNASADNYRRIMVTVYNKFNEMFWSNETGRYIGCISTENDRIDFGFTFLNTEALAAGLGNAKKAELIFSWLDGTRTVEGDTVQGSDIMDYSKLINTLSGAEVLKKTYFLCPRSNTKDIAGVTKNGKYWWDSLNGTIDVNSNAAYGRHLENGGYIFYTVYYELQAREKYQDSQSVRNRISQILDLWQITGLNSDYGAWAEGLKEEFPESGLFINTYIENLMGLSCQNGTISAAPVLPSAYRSLGVKEFCIDSTVYDICVTNDSISVCLDNSATEFHQDISLKVPENATCKAKYYTTSGVLIRIEEIEADENGFATVDKDIINEYGCRMCKIVISN